MEQDGSSSATPREYFSARGFELTFTILTEDEIPAAYEKTIQRLSSQVRKETQKGLSEGRYGPVFANLRGQNGLLVKLYGMGRDEASAGASAVRRWKVEQGD